MSSFKPDHVGIGELLRSDGTEAEMLRRATRVMIRAEATAPVDETGPHPGRYKESFHVESGKRRDRAYGRVVNDSPEAPHVEWGTRNNPRHRTLGKALDAAKD